MALNPVRIYISRYILASTTDEFILESMIQESQWIMDPKLFFWNISAVDLNIQIDIKLLFGTNNAHPAESGDYIDTFLEDTVILPGKRKVIGLDVAALVQPDYSGSFPLSHVIKTTNNSAQDIYCAYLLTGTYDETLRVLGSQNFIVRS